MSDDMISRNTIHEYYSRECVGHCGSCDYWDEKTDKCGLIDKLPAVQPKQKTGQWMINSDGYYPYCSRCKREPRSRIMTKYCAECGAFMEA